MNLIQVRASHPQLDPSVEYAARLLDDGEKAVIALASSAAGPVTALLDDAAGRKAASRLGIPVLGFIGLLLPNRGRSSAACALSPNRQESKATGSPMN